MTEENNNKYRKIPNSWNYSQLDWIGYCRDCE